MKIKTNSKNNVVPLRPTYYSTFPLNQQYKIGVFSIFRTGGSIYFLDGTHVIIPQESSVAIVVVSGDGKAWYGNNEYTNVDYIIFTSNNNGERRCFV